MNYIKLVFGIIIAVIITLLILWGVIATNVAIGLNNENIAIKNQKNLLLMDNTKYQKEAEEKQEIIKQYEDYKIKIKNTKTTKELYQLIKEWQ